MLKPNSHNHASTAVHYCHAITWASAARCLNVFLGTLRHQCWNVLVRSVLTPCCDTGYEVFEDTRWYFVCSFKLYL